MLVLILCNSSEFKQTQDDLPTGEWQICWESQIFNPPTFIACKYKIIFHKNRSYKLLKEDKIVGKGSVEFVMKSKKDKSRLYQIIYNESSGQSVGLSTYIPNRSLFIGSTVNDKIFFMDEDMDMATPYFLSKN